jgi:hypothetical protein
VGPASPWLGEVEEGLARSWAARTRKCAAREDFGPCEQVCIFFLSFFLFRVSYSKFEFTLEFQILV